nr:hypothetical protein RVX_2392 [Nitratidesulfovibrio sp. HK-II]
MRISRHHSPPPPAVAFRASCPAPARHSLVHPQMKKARPP